MTSPTPDSVLNELWAVWKASGDRRDHEAVVLAAQGDVRGEAGRVKKGAPRWVERDELMSSGQLGLLTAIESFDPSKGSTFAFHCRERIRWAILDGTRSADWVPKRVRSQGRQIHEAEGRLAHRLHRQPTDAELAGTLGWSIPDLERARHAVWQADLLTIPVEPDEDDEDDNVWATQQQAAFGSEVDHDVPMQEIREKLLVAISAVDDPTEQQVLKLYYVDDCSMAEVARTLGISASNVSKLRDRAIRTIQANLS